MGSVIEPIGTCHGLKSSNSPRIVTRITHGTAQFRSSENVLMQLPTPLDCISSAARSPPSVAPSARPAPSASRGQHHIDDLVVLTAQRDQPREPVIRDVADLADAVRLNTAWMRSGQLVWADCLAKLISWSAA